MVSAASIKNHIVEHEILGITAGGGGGGSITIIDGYPTYTDTSRGGKTLSINRNTFMAGKQGKAKDLYLRTADSIATSKTGIRMIKAGTITGISFQLSTSATCALHVYKNDGTSPLVTVSLVAIIGAHSSTLNVDFVEGDRLQFYIDGTCYDPLVWIETAWRF